MRPSLFRIDSVVAIRCRALLNTTMERLQATDPADSVATPRSTCEALGLSATANRLIDEATLEFEFEPVTPDAGPRWPITPSVTGR